MQKPIFAKYKIDIQNFTVPHKIKYNFAKQFMTNKIINMTQKEKLELATGEKMPEPTEQEYKREQIPGTPFWKIGSNEKGWNLILGKYKLNQDPIESEELLEQWIEYNHWTISMSMILAITTDMLNNQNKQ